MKQRTRKLIGLFLLLALVIVYSLIVMALSASHLWDANAWLQGLYYLIVGMGWVLPAMPIIKWMQKAD
jgi:hypothetical protein